MLRNLWSYVNLKVGWDTFVKTKAFGKNKRKKKCSHLYELHIEDNSSNIASTNWVAFVKSFDWYVNCICSHLLKKYHIIPKVYFHVLKIGLKSPLDKNNTNNMKTELRASKPPSVYVHQEIFYVKLCEGKWQNLF